ncbi:unnamed protein product [Xylocopa violacea]|uniref:Uncharacterized protein n=1 Tax=Xylocopa violacea TaxID=135666 RepID=A0ABP1PC55_XYLVO
MKTLEGKVVALGSQGVGKTSMIVRYVGKSLNQHVNPTIGASFFTCKLNIKNARVVLQVWDTAGQERFKSMAPMYYRNANAAMLVFDLTKYNTFAAMKQWVTELRRNVEEAMILVVIGNKSDLRKERQVDAEEGRVYATKIGASYHETSVLQGYMKQWIQIGTIQICHLYHPMRKVHKILVLLMVYKKNRTSAVKLKNHDFPLSII